VIWRRRPPKEVLIERSALDGAAKVAEEALPAETGGILIGWRTEEAIRVYRMPHVPDHEATASSYQRNHAVAEAVLQLALAAPCSHSALGYVGEWHCHPAPLPSSARDRREIASISRLAGGAVALVVLVRGRDGVWSSEATTALSRNVAPAVVKVEEGSE